MAAGPQRGGAVRIARHPVEPVLPDPPARHAMPPTKPTLTKPYRTAQLAHTLLDMSREYGRTDGARLIHIAKTVVAVVLAMGVSMRLELTAPRTAMVAHRHGRDYTPLYRFLIARVGREWDQVFSEAKARLDRTEPIFLLVARTQEQRRDFVRVGESSYFSGLYVDEQGLLQRVNPLLRPEDMEPGCTCCKVPTIAPALPALQSVSQPAIVAISTVRGRSPWP